MFDYRLKDIFKTYVDNDNFILKKITNGNISQKFVHSDDWKSLNDGDIVYFNLDDCYHYGTEMTNFDWYCYYVAVNVTNGLNHNVTKVYFTIRKSTSDNFTLTCCGSLSGNPSRDGGAKKTYSDIITIEDKRYLVFTWSEILFGWLLCGNTYNPSVEYLDELNYGYNLYQTFATYDWYDSILDFDYLYSHSGDKLISPLVYKLLEDDKTITETNLNKIVEIIKTRYLDKWNKLYQALVVNDYNPIENYSMTEVETPNITKTYHREQNTNIEVSDDGESTSSVYAFNSSTPTPSGKAEVDNTRTTSGDKDDNYQDGEDTESGTRELERSGNIGVTTTQQMLEQEIEIKKHNFYDIVYGDIDNVIALEIY